MRTPHCLLAPAFARRATRLPLARSLADDVPPFDPAHPAAPEKFAVPASPQRTGETPLGN